MNVKSSPSSSAGPNRRARSAKKTRVRSTSSPAVASKQPAESTRPGGGVRGSSKRKRTTAQAEIEPTFGSRLRAFLPAAALPNGIVVMVAIVFALIALIATSTSMAALPSTIAQFWLVTNMVPVHGDGHTIGYLPMLPAALLAMVVAKRVHALVKEKVSLADLGVLLLCVLLLPILLTLTAAAMLYDASVVYPVGVPNIALAIGMTALLHGSAFVIGMGRRLWRAILKRFSMPTWLVDSALLGARGLAVIGAVSLAGVIISLAIHYQAASEALAAYDSALGITGAIVVSILYLPNAVVAAGAMMAGSEFHFGEALFSLFGVNMVPLPPVPLLAALPASVHPWAAGLLVVMAVSIVYAVYRHVPRFATGLVAAIFAGLFSLILSVFASGTLGVYGYVGPHLWMTAGFVLAWFAAVISLAVAVVALISRRVAGELSDADDEEFDGDLDAADEPALDTEAETEAEPEANTDAEAETEVDGEAEVDNGELDEETATVDTEDASIAESDDVVVDDPITEGDDVAAPEPAKDSETTESPEAPNEDETAQDLHIEGGEEELAQPISDEETAETSDDTVTNDSEQLSEAALSKPVTTEESESDTDPEQAQESWHADVFDDVAEEPSEVADQIQQEALDEYESAEPAQRAEPEEIPPATKRKKKRRRGGIFRRK